MHARRDGLSAPVGLALLAASLAFATTARAAPEDRGPYTVTEWDAGPVAADGTRIRTRVVFAPEAPPGPLVGIMHGNLREGRFHMELAQTFASRGVVVILPDMPCGAGGCDHEANARQLIALLDWAAVQGATSGSRVEGRVDPERRALVGHSWGGLGSFLATASSASVDAWVGLDPEEDRGAALGVAARVGVPSAHLMAEVPGLCNGDWGEDIYAATAAPHLRLTIDASGHCDPELPTDFLCPLGCGMGDDATTPLFRRYTIAFVLCALGMDASMAEWVGGPSFAADESAGRLVGVRQAGLETMRCGGLGPGEDAGTGALDAGPGSVTDSGSASVTDAGAGMVTDAGAGMVTDAGAGTVTDSGAVTDGGAGTVTDSGSIADSGSGSIADSGSGPGSSAGSCACRAVGGRRPSSALLACLAALVFATVTLRARARTAGV